MNECAAGFPRHLPLVVGTKEAARLLNTSVDHLTALVEQGALMEHPQLSFAKKRAFAVRELERFVSIGVNESSSGRMRVVS
jgi:hypothetical protein